MMSSCMCMYAFMAIDHDSCPHHHKKESHSKKENPKEIKKMSQFLLD